MHIRNVAMLLFCGILVTASFPVSVTNAEHQQNVTYVDDLVDTIPSVNDSYTFQIDIWFMMSQNLDTNAFLQRLPKWYAPVERYPTFFSSSPVFDVNYTLVYNVRYFNSSEILEFRNQIYNWSNVGMAPLYLGNLSESARYVPSDPVEDYLVGEGIQNPTMVFIDTYTPDPTGFEYYYYNASSFDIDGYSNPRPYGATYQVSGGGHKAPLLWFDFSAGPTNYRGDVFPHITQMNETSLMDAMVDHLQRAIELRFIPSWIYSPIYGYDTVTFDFVLVDLTNGNYDFLSKLNTTYLLEQYSQLNPYATWQTSIRTWDYQNDSTFMNILASSKNTTDHSYDSWNILSYLESIKPTMFNSSTKENLIIPVFLFGFPDDWLFDAFLGLADNEGQNFSFVVAAANERWSDPTPDLEPWLTTQTTLPSGAYVYFNSSFGYTNNILRTTVNSDQPVNVYLLNPFEYEKYVSGGNFTPIMSYSGVTSLEFNYTTSVYQNYYWVIENAGANTATVDWQIDSFEDRSFGFTFVVMHETGHAFGLSHPHDGFSWQQYEQLGYGEIFDWTWDLSYTQMSYAHHYSDISIMDMYTYYRGIFPKMSRDIQQDFENIIVGIKQSTNYVPSHVKQLVDLVDGVMWNYSLVFGMWQESNVPSYLLDYLHVKPMDFFEMAYTVRGWLDELRNYTFDISLPITVSNGNATDYILTIVDQDTGKIYYNGSLADLSNITLGWVKVSVIVTRTTDGMIVTQDVNTWEVSEIAIDLSTMPAITSTPASTSETSTDMSSNTSNPSLSQTHTPPNETSESAPAPISLIPIFMALVAIAVRKLHVRKQI